MHAPNYAGLQVFIKLNEDVYIWKKKKSLDILKPAEESRTVCLHQVVNMFISALKLVMGIDSATIQAAIHTSAAFFSFIHVSFVFQPRRSPLGDTTHNHTHPEPPCSACLLLIFKPFVEIHVQAPQASIIDVVLCLVIIKKESTNQSGVETLVAASRGSDGFHWFEQ